ncbi:TonB-dependent siderophore receptor [Nostoc sp.]|uniref:TonB-dependent siderophore receptor n=1 Tax=Nostoc sp. TaxID=1180 RepID=UPI002FF8CA5D
MKGRICLPKMRLLLVASLIGYIFSFVVSEPVLAQVKTKGKESTTDIQFPVNNSGLLWQSSTPQPTPSVEVVQITGVKANPTTIGLELILQTTVGEQLQVTNRSASNNFIADIPNAQLRLPSGEGFTFRLEKPLTGITQISVINFDNQTIRVTVVGEASLPTIELYDSDEGLIFAVASATQQGEQPQASPTPSAQKPESETQSQPPSTQGDQPIELVVTGEQDSYSVTNATTATRTDTPLRDIPQSIQVVSQQVIKDQQVTRLEEALQNVSSVTFRGNTQGRGEVFSIRGFGSPFSPTPVLRDGFRTYSFYQGFSEVGSLERVEVLKGPASILYGDIQPGGLINLVSKQPLSQPFYETELQIGSQELVRPRFDISGPLTTDGSLLYRLNGLYQHSTSFRDFTTDRDRFFIAPALSWKIDQNTDLSVSLDYIHDKGPADQGLPALGNRVAPIPYNRVINDPDDNITNEYLTTGYSFEHRFSDSWKIRNTFRYIYSSYNYNVAAVPLSIDDTTGIENRVFATQDSTERSYSLQTNVQGKFNTGAVKHTFLFGVDFNHSDQSLNGYGDFFTLVPLDIFNPVYTPKPNVETFPLVSGTQENDNRLGIYLQDQFYLLKNLIVLAGLRYDTITQKSTTAAALFSSAGESTQDNDAVTPRVGIVYQPIKELSLYASYSQSFTPNSATTVSGTPLEPERGEGYEVGVKTDLLNSKLFATLAYFDITKRNVAATDPNNPLFSIATGKQQSNGVELDITGEILPGWKAIANYAYINARVTDDTDSALVGSQLPGIPFHSAGLWTTYQLQSGNLKGLGFGIGFNYVGERQGGLPNSFRVDSYFVPNAAIFYQRDNLRFAVNFKNLFDVDYIRTASTGRANGIEPGEPFTVIGSVSVQF